MSMYYDRRLTPEVHRLLLPGQPLAWMVDLLQTPWGDDNYAHIEFRRSESGSRTRGGIQFYTGRTAPLEALGAAKWRVAFDAAKDPYQAQTPVLFETRFEVAALGSMRATLEEHLRVAAANGNRSFLDGEAQPHAGLMRRYSLGHRAGDPLLAIDSEIRVGFSGTKTQTGTQEREAMVARLRQAIGLPRREGTPQKHDTIGLLPEGDVALVEVKDQQGDMARAVRQAAAFVYRFEALTAQPGYDLEAVLSGMVEQKVSAGLMPAGTTAAMGSQRRFVPIIAAPDSRPDWASHWMQDSAEARRQAGRYPDGLRFWRLSQSGTLLEEVVP